METFNQENRKTETMNGNSIQMPTCSDMVRRELKMALLWPFMPRDMRINFQKQLLLRRLLKTIEPSLKTFLVYRRIWDKARPTEDKTLSMVSKMFKVIIHGMPLDAFMVNQIKKKLYQTMTLENLLSQIAEMLLELKLIDKDPSVAQPSVKISHSRISGVLLIIK